PATSPQDSTRPPWSRISSGATRVDFDLQETTSPTSKYSDDDHMDPASPHYTEADTGVQLELPAIVRFDNSKTIDRTPSDLELGSINDNGAQARWNVSDIDNINFSSGYGNSSPNTTLIATTISIKITPNCVTANAITSPFNATALNVALNSVSCNSANFTHTNISDTNEPDMAISVLPQCGPSIEDVEFLPVAFVAFAGNAATASICSPKLQVVEVNVSVEISDGDTWSRILGNLPDANNSLTQAPLFNQSPNGVALNSSVVATPLLSSRLASINSALGAAVLASLGQTTGTIGSDELTAATNKVYGTFLSLVASKSFFGPDLTQAKGTVTYNETRLLTTGLSTHLLAGLFSVGAPGASSQSGTLIPLLQDFGHRWRMLDAGPRSRTPTLHIARFF
ncbi:hypothetical protein P7C70_g8874, partial [Phenoliferia sp. Uapishka_3]